MNQFIEMIVEWGEFLDALLLREPSKWGIYTPVFWIGVFAGIVGAIYLVRLLALRDKEVMPLFVVFVLSFFMLVVGPIISLVVVAIFAILLKNIVFTVIATISASGLSIWYRKLKSRTMSDAVLNS